MLVYIGASWELRNFGTGPRVVYKIYRMMRFSWGGEIRWFVLVS